MPPQPVGQVRGGVVESSGVAEPERESPTARRRQRQPGTASERWRRQVYLNPELWRAMRDEASRRHQSVSGYVACLVEHDLGWDD